MVAKRQSTSLIGINREGGRASMGSGSVRDRPSVLSMTGSTPTGDVHPHLGCKYIVHLYQYLRTFGTSIRVLLVPVLEPL